MEHRELGMGGGGPSFVFPNLSFDLKKTKNKNKPWKHLLCCSLAQLCGWTITCKIPAGLSRRDHMPPVHSFLGHYFPRKWRWTNTNTIGLMPVGAFRNMQKLRFFSPLLLIQSSSCQPNTFPRLILLLPRSIGELNRVQMPFTKKPCIAVQPTLQTDAVLSNYS